MAEYISKEDLIKAVEDADVDIVADYGDYDCECGFSRDELSQIINSIPIADVEPVRHGVWEPIIDGFGCLEGWIHPECGRTTREASQYCPTCGAKMDLED